MAKRLIIKDADFSVNAIGSTGTGMELAQGTISGSSSSSGWGNWDFSSASYNGKRVKTARSAGILVPNGGTVRISGMKGLGYGYFVYNTNEPIHDNCLDIGYCQETPTLNAENNSVVEYTNTVGRSVWIWFIFKWLGTDGIHSVDANIAPTDVSLAYNVL